MVLPLASVARYFLNQERDDGSRTAVKIVRMVQIHDGQRILRELDVPLSSWNHLECNKLCVKSHASRQVHPKNLGISNQKFTFLLK